MQMQSLEALSFFLSYACMIDAFCKNTEDGVSKTGFTSSVMQIVVVAVRLSGFAGECVN
jgi:hypothetical protein